MTEFEKHIDQLQELESLRSRLEEAEETLRAIKSGEVDALVMDTGSGEQIFTLRTAETAYRVAIESISEGVLTLSADGLIIYANSAMGYLLNTPLEQLTGESVFEFIDAVNGDSLAELLQNGSGRHEISFRAGEGMTVSTLVSITALPVTSSPVLTLVAVVTDLTELKRRDEVIAQGKLLRESEGEARKQLAEIQAIYDTAPVGLAVLDRDLRYLRINQRLAEMNGLPASEHIGKTVDQVVPSLGPMIKEIGERIFATGIGVTDVEFSGSLPSRPGERRTWLEQWMPLKDADGRVIALNVVVEEVTARKKAEETLRQYELLAANTRDIILFLNYRDGQILEANKAAVAAYGYSRDELLTKKIGDLRAKEPQSLVEQQLARANSQGILFETFHVRKDGTWFPVEVSSQGIDFNGQRTLISVIRDITERKRQEEMLQQALSEAEEGRATLSALMENIPIGITIARMPDLKIQMVSKRGQELLGVPHAGMNVGEVANRWKVFQEDGKTPLADQDLPLARAASGENVINVEVVQVNEWGKSLNLLCSASPIRQGDRITGAVVAWRDVTERRQIEEKLKASEKKYRGLFEGMSEGFILCEVITDQEGKPVDYRFLEANPATEAFFRRPCSEIIGNTYRTIGGRNADPEWIKILGGVAQTGEPVTLERYAPVGGQWVSLQAYSPNPGQFAATFTDITDRKKAEQALKASEERYRALVDLAPDAIVVHRDGRIYYANAPAIRVFGAGSFEELAAYNIFDLIHPEDVEKARNSVESVQHGATTRMSERRAFRLDGQRWDMEAAGSPIDWRGERCVQVIIRDVTERKKAAQELAAAKEHLEEEVAERTHELQAQVETTKRAEADLRSLSAKMIVAQEEERRTIAKELHDEVGQTLTVLKLMAGSLNRAIPEELKPRLEAINKELTDVMMRVRLMSQTLRPTVLDDLGLVPGLEWLFARLKEQAGLQIEFDCPKLENLDQKVSITVYRIIQESLTNVMRHSGVKFAFVHISFDENYLMVRVTDYGRGFKHDEVHTSTGLSAMRERAKLLDGKVEVKSEPGKGTVVTLKIPWKPSETKI